MLGSGRRWPREARLTAALAAICGAVAFLLTQGYVARVEASRPELGPPVPVVVAGRDIARGATLGADALEVRRMPDGFVPPGALRDVAGAEGRVLLAPLTQGEAVTVTRLAAPHAGPVAALIPPGLRAYVVATDVPPEVIRAGDRVDVLGTFGGGRPYTETVASGLEVLSVLGPGSTDALSGAPSDAPRLVLLVSPDTAERLAYAASFGDLSVTIAGAQDEGDPSAVSAPSDGG